MNYSLDDDIFKLSYIIKDENEIFEFGLFCSFYKIHTIGDFLKHGDAVRSEITLKEIVEEFKKIEFKFDDELTEKELEIRNSEREKIEMNNRRKIAQRRIERILKKDISALELPTSIIRKLNNHEIFKIYELIDGSSFILFGKNITIFKESELNKITKALQEYGLYLNMLNPKTESLDIKVPLDLEGEAETTTEEPEEKEITTEEIVEDKAENIEKVEEEKEPTVIEEEKEPTAIEEEKMTKTEKPSKATKRRIIKWEDRINYIKAFYIYFGHTFIPEKFTDADNIGKWVSNNRSAWKNGRLSSTKINDLESAGMSKKGTGSNLEAKKRKFESLNIQDIILKNGVLYTYYLDGKIKSTNDEEFIKMLNGEEIAETKDDNTDIQIETTNDVKTSDEMYTDDEVKSMMQEVFNQPTEEIETDSNIENQDSQDLYSLMESRIQEMKSQKQAIVEENTRKEELINEYRELKSKLDDLINESIKLDEIIQDLIGISSVTKIEEQTFIKVPLTIAELQEIKDKTKQMLDEKTEENKRKQKLIKEFRDEERDLKQAQKEGEELDTEICSIFNQNDNKVKKIGDK